MSLLLPNQHHTHAATFLRYFAAPALFFLPPSFLLRRNLSQLSLAQHAGSTCAGSRRRRVQPRRRRRRHFQRPPQDRRPLLRSCVGVAGAGDHPGAPPAKAQGERQGRQGRRPDPRRHRRRRGGVRPPPLRRQQAWRGRGGRGRGEVRGAAAGAGARIPGAVAEALVPGGYRVAAHAGHRGGRSAAGRPLRRAGAAPPLHAPARQGVPRCRAHRGLALPPRQRPLAGARRPPPPPRRRREAAKVASEARGAEGVHGAERRHGQPAAHLHGGLHRGRPRGAGAGQVAVPVVRDVPGPAAAHPPLLPVPEPRQLRPVPAHVAAAPPPRRALPPPRRPLQHPSLHAVQAQGAAEGGGVGSGGGEGRRRRRRQVGASCEEGEGCQRHVFSRQEKPSLSVLLRLSEWNVRYRGSPLRADRMLCNRS